MGIALIFKKEFEKDLKRNLTIQELKMHNEVAHLSFISEVWKILKGMHEKIKNNHDNDKMPSFFYYCNEQNENLLEKSELKKMKIIY
jgi:hypothetical protein